MAYARFRYNNVGIVRSVEKRMKKTGPRMMWKGVMKAVMTTTTTTRPCSTVSENYFFSWSEAKENSRRRLISPKGLNKKKSVKSRNADEGNDERVVLIILTNLSKRKKGNLPTFKY